ncbi:MAG: hypothetical protein ACFCGT_24215 [Sandaracinaceae bacterium]
MAEPDGPIEMPPEGAGCAEHPERPARAVCPRCGSYSCLACWHGSLRRCHACLRRDPAAAAPPIGWERPEHGWIRRYASTYASALRPYTSGAMFARGGWVPAATFAVLSFVPLAALAGVIPFTHTLVFGEELSFGVVGGRTPDQIALDVLWACGVGLVAHGLGWLTLALPYLSLARAYAQRAHPEAPVRVLLYRAWLVPTSALLLQLLLWSSPAEPPGAYLSFMLVLATVPLVLLFASLFSSARMGSGIGPIWSMVVCAVALAVFLVANNLVLAELFSSLLPDPAALEAGARPEG